MTAREAQIEALWTYEISTEKILRRAVKKGFISQAEADNFSEKLFEQLDTGKIPGFRPSPLREKVCAEDVRVNPYISMTEIAREKKTSSPSYLIQSWMRSNTTIKYLRMREKIYNPQFQEDACNELIHATHTTGTTLTPSLWINTTTCVRNADKPWQGRRDNSASRDCRNVPGVAVSRVYVGIGPVVSNVSA